jgi:TRAP-type C4-dicarboxylate transport system permease large subunit
MGGIYGGVFTPTEAAVVAAVYSILVALFVYRDMGPLKETPWVLASDHRRHVSVSTPVSTPCPSSWSG